MLPVELQSGRDDVMPLLQYDDGHRSSALRFSTVKSYLR